MVIVGIGNTSLGIATGPLMQTGDFRAGRRRSAVRRPDRMPP
jgi:hypothetical protein